MKKAGKCHGVLLLDLNYSLHPSLQDFFQNLHVVLVLRSCHVAYENSKTWSQVGRCHGEKIELTELQNKLGRWNDGHHKLPHIRTPVDPWKPPNNEIAHLLHTQSCHFRCFEISPQSHEACFPDVQKEMKDLWSYLLKIFPSMCENFRNQLFQSERSEEHHY